MNIRQINLTLQSAAILLGVAVLLALVGGLLMPVTAPQVATEIAAAKPRDATPALPSVNSFDAIFDKPFQGASSAAAVIKADTVPAETGAAVSQLQMVGSVGNSVALIKGPDGTVGMVEVGDDVDGALVLAIRPSQVDLRQNGTVTTLTKTPTPDPAASILGKQ